MGITKFIFKKLHKIRRHCRVSKNVQLIQNFNKAARFAIKITKNPTFNKNPADVFGKSDTLTLRCFNPKTKTPSTAKIIKTTNKVNNFGGSILSYGFEVSMICSVR